MPSLTRTARLTGLAYLGLAISGMLSFLLARQQLYVPDDALATAANLVGHEGLARLGTAVDLTVVLTQALAAVMFYRLFRGVDAVAAGAVAAFGLVNAVVILVATACSATALHVALAAGTPADGQAGAGGQAGLPQVLFDLSDASWNLGGLFFGLWLIPMGWLAWRSGYVPRALGWLLIVGGVGYVLGAYLLVLAPDLASVASALVAPATAGELWMVGYLLWGVRPVASPLADALGVGHGGIPAHA